VFVGRMAGARVKSRKGVEQGRLVLQHSRLSLQPCCSRSSLKLGDPRPESCGGDYLSVEVFLVNEESRTTFTSISLSRLTTTSRHSGVECKVELNATGIKAYSAGGRSAKAHGIRYTPAL
jgi:hypothetical protein